MYMRCPVRAFKYGGNYSLIGGAGIVEWHYFTVFDEYLGMEQRFRWRETSCDFSGPGGVDYQFQLYCGLCGEYESIMDFIDLEDGIKYCRDYDFRHFYRDFHVF